MEQPSTLAELEPLLRAIGHGVAAGEVREALDDVLWRRVHRGAEFFASHHLGAFASALTAVAHFFEGSWRSPDRRLPDQDKAIVQSWAGSALQALGRLDEVVQLYEAALERLEGHEDWRLASAQANLLAQVLRTLGRLDDIDGAEGAARAAMDHADRANANFYRVVTRAMLADVLHQRGELDRALELFEAAEALQASDQPEYPMLYSHRGYAFCDLLITMGRAEEANRRAEALGEWAAEVDSLLDSALARLISCRARAVSDDPATAPTLDELDLAVTGLREAGHQEFLVAGLLERALFWSRAIAAGRGGDEARATQDLDEALVIAERGSMRLLLADVHLERARLAFATGDDSHGHAELTRGIEFVRATGYGRRVAATQEIGSSA